MSGTKKNINKAAYKRKRDQTICKNGNSYSNLGSTCNQYQQ